jgi:hypothetical protein
MGFAGAAGIAGAAAIGISSITRAGADALGAITVSEPNRLGNMGS